MSNETSGYVAQLMQIIGLDRAEAESLLELNNFNLEQAINHHLEMGFNAPTSAQASVAGIEGYGESSDPPPAESVLSTSAAHRIGGGDAAGNSIDSDATVRAPIPAKREQLVMPEDDNFRFRKRRAPAFSVCPLRNFAREAEIQEEELNTYLDGGTSNGGSSVSSFFSNPNFRSGTGSSGGGSGHIAVNSRLDGNGTVASGSDCVITPAMSKRARLEDLFRPPIDLLFWGTFHAARDYATLQNRWLIVNLQDNAEFKSQIINRDIWSDSMLKELVHRYFVLWQVSVDIPEGLRFKAFYKVETMPYVCVIDPRTGEEKRIFDVVTAQTFLSDLNDYLEANSYTLDERSSTPTTHNSPGSRFIAPTSLFTKSSSPVASSSSAISTLQSNCDLVAVGRSMPSLESRQAAELSEEDQLALAIKNSLQEIQQDSTEKSITVAADENSRGDVITLSDSDDEAAATVTFEKYLGDKNDPVTIIQLRLPNGQRTQLEWPSSTKLGAIKLYVQSTYPNDTQEPYKVISAFSRQNILELDQNSNLIDADLHPRAVLHLHPDN